MFRLSVHSLTTTTKNTLRRTVNPSRALVGSSYINNNNDKWYWNQQQQKFWMSTESTDRGSNGGIFDKIAFVGAGKMAQALVEPLIKTGLQPEDTISIYDVSTSTVKSVKKKFPTIQVAESIPELIDNADLVVCAVKPQNLVSSFFEQFPQSKIRNDATLLSILAGKGIDDLRPIGFQKIVRSMPNTPATIGQGMTVWSCTPNIMSGERDRIKDVLCTFGKTIYVDDEKFVDMSTSISGSGPAYIFLLMEAMIDAGVHMGFSRETATTLCYHTLLGSTLYAMETGQHPAILRNLVTSPAGTTASAIYELENGRFRVVIKDAIWACYRRSLEMGGKDSGVGPGRHVTTSQEVVHHHYNNITPGGEMKDRNDDSDFDSDEEK